MAEQSNWTFRIKNASGSVVCNLPKATNRKLKLKLNAAGEASFDYDMQSFLDIGDGLGFSTVQELVGLGRFTLEVLRGSTLMFGGQMLVLDQSMTDIQRTIHVTAIGFFWLLGTRYAGLSTPREFSSVDAGTIAWTLIDEAQGVTNGNFGITQGSIEASIARTMSYSRKSVREAIEELSNADSGFDFEVTPAKVFNTYYPFKGTDRTDTVKFRYPGNIREIEELRDATKIVNYAFVIGRGWGNEEVTTSDEDTESEASFKRREAIYSFKDIENTAILADLAGEAINVFKNVVPVYKLRVVGNNSVTVEDFGLGDIVEVHLNDPVWQLTQDFRVFEINVDIEDTDKEDIELVVGLI